MIYKLKLLFYKLTNNTVFLIFLLAVIFIIGIFGLINLILQTFSWLSNVLIELLSGFIEFEKISTRDIFNANFVLAMSILFAVFYLTKELKQFRLKNSQLEN